MPEKRSIHLIGVGKVLAVPAIELVPGDKVMFNYGSVYTVTGIVKQTPKTIVFTMRHDKTGHEYETRKGKQKLMARLHNERATA